jgi:hypothetical protein
MPKTRSPATLPVGQSTRTEVKASQNAITGFFSRPLPAAAREEGDELLLRAIVVGGVPFAFVDNEFLIAFCSQISQQRYTPPCELQF